MFGFSGEHLLVLLVILLIFGPKRLPDLGHSIGRTLKNFKDAMNGQESATSAAAASRAIPPVSQIPAQPQQTETVAQAVAEKQVAEKT